MELTGSLIALTAAIAVGTISPGPSFLMVARTALGTSRANGIAAALGMGVGGALFSIAALLGLHAALLSLPSVYAAFKLAGAIYLLWLALQIARQAKSPLTNSFTTTVSSMQAGAVSRSSLPGLRSAFRSGLLTQISNPKTAVVYASVFAALLPPALPQAAAVLIPMIIFSIEFCWYAVVAIALSANAPRTAYAQCKPWIDRTAAAAMALLGGKLLLSVRDS